MTALAAETRKGFSLQAAGAGLLAAFVGFASSFAVVIQGLLGIGASPAEAASGLMALSLAMGLCGVYLSRSEEHTSELQSLMRITYAVICLKKIIRKIQIIQ